MKHTASGVCACKSTEGLGLKCSLSLSRGSEMEVSPCESVLLTSVNTASANAMQTGTEDEPKAWP